MKAYATQCFYRKTKTGMCPFILKTTITSNKNKLTSKLNWVPVVIIIYNLTSSSPKECLLLGPGCGENLEVWVALVETRISFVRRCILASKADLASSSCSSLDCSLTLPSSSFSYDEQTIVSKIYQNKKKRTALYNSKLYWFRRLFGHKRSARQITLNYGI
jgi:hypothetical protein